MPARSARKNRHFFSTIIAVFLILAIGFGIYTGNYYHASESAVFAINDDENYSVESFDGKIAFIPQEPIAGIIFYPGAKVEHTAYSPFAAMLAEQNVLCVICEMPFRFAFFDINAADGIMERFPEVKCWYMGGHSLGGAMAASYVAKKTDDYTGLILLGAYSTSDMSKSNLRVASIYGSEDGVLNKQKYEDEKKNLPSSFTEYIITGGCHAYFGDYGMQRGDGTPTITRKEQMTQTTDIILQLLSQH